VPTLAAAVLAAVTTAAACSANPGVQLDAHTTGQAGPTGQPATAGSRPVTETVTATVTVTVSATVAPTGAATTGTAPPAGPTHLPTAPSVPGTFDDGAARAAITRLISGIGRLDQEFARPAGAPTSLASVDDDLAALLAAGVPPGTDGPSYVARILSLRVFVSAVRSEVGTDRAQATARYAVVRQETGVLLGQLNVALRAAYVLPPPPSPSPTTSTTPTTP
jgi:hypothetical protein